MRGFAQGTKHLKGETAFEYGCYKSFVNWAVYRLPLPLSRHGFNQQDPKHLRVCWLLGTHGRYPTKCFVSIGYPTTNIKHPPLNTNPKMVLGTAFGRCWVPSSFTKKFKHEKRIISGFLLSKKQASYGWFWILLTNNDGIWKLLIQRWVKCCTTQQLGNNQSNQLLTNCWLPNCWAPNLEWTSIQ